MGKHSKKTIIDEAFTMPYPPARAYPAPPPIPVGYPAPPPCTAPATTDNYRSATAKVMVTGDAATAEVSYQIPPDPKAVKAFENDKQAQFYGAYPQPKIFTGSGASKRERGDAHDPVTGEILAVARAYDELAARLYREARRRVRAQDAEQEQRSRRRTREEWERLQRTSQMAANLGLAPEQVVTRDGVPLDEEVASIDATVVVRKSLMDAADHLQTVIDLLHA